MRRPWAVLLLTLLAIRYLHWRIGSSLNFSSALAASLSLLMLAAELLLLAGFHLQLWFSLALPARPVSHPLPPPAAGGLPSVDVLVPSYGEPPELIERCLRACLAMDYPCMEVWLLDDSGRSELRQLCDRMGCRYLAREERTHAKAGNLNHGLRHCRGELVAVFDADVVPLRTFLQRTVPFFRDPHVGFVQTPQSYMNADPVMRNLGLERWLMPDEESFYRWIEPTRAALGAVVCAGTSFVVQRRALDRVGGFETGTPSEDLATGIRITAAGFRNVFLNEKLSAGLAALTAAAMARQRCRWASGTLQTLRTGASPLSIPGLNPLQRLAYLEGILHWAGMLAQLLLMLTPLSLGLLGVAPIRVSDDGLLTTLLPFYLAQILLLRWLNGHSRTALLPEVHRWIFLVPLCASVLATIAGHPRRFQVTPKAISRDRQLGIEPRLLLPLLFLLSLQGLALLHLLTGRLPAAMAVAVAGVSPASRVLVVGWGVLNAAMLLLAIRACRDRPGGDAFPWFAPSQPPELRLTAGAHQEGAGPAHGLREKRSPAGRPARLEAISERGAEFALPPAPGSALLRQGSSVLVEGLIDGPPLPLTVAAITPGRLGGCWGDLSYGQWELLQELLYRRPGLWPVLVAPLELRALPALAQRLLGPMPAEDWFHRSLIPQHSPAAPGASGRTANKPLTPLAPGRALPQPSSRQASP